MTLFQHGNNELTNFANNIYSTTFNTYWDLNRMGYNYYYCWYSHSSISSLLPVNRQAVTQSIPDLLLTAPLGTNFNKFQIKIQNFTFDKIVFEHFYQQNVSRFVEASFCEVEKSAFLTYILFQLFVKVNTLRLRENGRHFAEDIFKCIFVNENLWIPIKISPKFVPKGPINNISALVQTANGLAPTRRQAIIWTNDG